MPFSESERSRALKLLLSISPIIILGIAAAGSVTVTSNNFSGQAGVYFRPYYEDSNPPMTGCAAPCLSTDTQSSFVPASGSFTLPAGASMYLWSPEFSSQTFIPAGSLSFQLFADPPAPTLDAVASGSWSSGVSFTIASLTTANSNDVIILSIVTNGPSAVSVTSISDSLDDVAWQTSPRAIVSTCTGDQNSTLIEWYGIANTTLTNDVITVQLTTIPISASGIAFGVAGADTVTPFDPNVVLPGQAFSCSPTASIPSVGGVSFDSDADYVFSLFGGYTPVDEVSGVIGNASGTLIATVASTGDSNAAEYVSESATQSSVSCDFGEATTYYGILCDALMPAIQSLLVSYETAYSVGTVQSTMISASAVTTTGLHPSVSIPSASGIIPALGYVLVVITDPTDVPLTILWGSSDPTNFQVTFAGQP
jgi:hypothetical protein